MAQPFPDGVLAGFHKHYAGVIITGDQVMTASHDGVFTVYSLDTTSVPHQTVTFVMKDGDDAVLAIAAWLNLGRTVRECVNTRRELERQSAFMTGLGLFNPPSGQPEPDAAE